MYFCRRNKRYVSMSNNKHYQKLIHTARWLKLRKERLSKHPICERCQEEGRNRLASEVHHIVPVETAVTPQDMERLMFDYFNLRALCHDCHVKTHVEMGRSGKPYAERKRKSDLELFRQKFLTDEVPVKTIPTRGE